MNTKNTDIRSTVDLFSKMFLVYGAYDIIAFVLAYRNGSMADKSRAFIIGLGIFMAALAILKVITGILGLQQAAGRKLTIHITLATVAVTLQMLKLIGDVFGYLPPSRLGITDLAVSLAAVLSLVLFTKYAKALNRQ